MFLQKSVDSGTITVIVRNRRFAQSKIAEKKPEICSVSMHGIAAPFELRESLPNATVCVNLRPGAMTQIVTAVFSLLLRQ